MEEKEVQTSEGLEGTNLNQTETKTYTAEEVEAIRKKMQSDTDRGVQKILHEKSFYQDVLDSVAKVAKDSKYLIELSIEKPEVAKTMLDKYYDGMSLAEYKKHIGYEDVYDPKLVEKEVSIRVQKEIESKHINKAKEDFIKKLQMTDEEKEAFEEAFDERKSMKSFSVDNVEKHLEKAYREISDIDIIKRVEKDTVVANIIANQDSKSSSGDVSKPKTRTDRLLEEAEDFFKTYGKF